MYLYVKFYVLIAINYFILYMYLYVKFYVLIIINYFIFLTI